MALFSARTVITSLSLLHITLAFFFLTNPSMIEDQGLVYVIGESMGMVRSLSSTAPSINPLYKSYITNPPKTAAGRLSLQHAIARERIPRRATASPRPNRPDLIINTRRSLATPPLADASTSPRIRVRTTDTTNLVNEPGRAIGPVAAADVARARAVGRGQLRDRGRGRGPAESRLLHLRVC